MTGNHKFAKYFATTLAVILIVSMVYGAVRIVKLIAERNGGGTSVSSETDDRQKTPSDESDPQTPASQTDPTGTSEQREPLLPGDPTVPQERFLATNQYVQKFLEEVEYPCTNDPDTDKEYSYSSIIG